MQPLPLIDPVLWQCPTEVIYLEDMNMDFALHCMGLSVEVLIGWLLWVCIFIGSTFIVGVISFSIHKWYKNKW